jgi:hypothetical protein
MHAAHAGDVRQKRKGRTQIRPHSHAARHALLRAHGPNDVRRSAPRAERSRRVRCPFPGRSPGAVPAVHRGVHTSVCGVHSCCATRSSPQKAFALRGEDAQWRATVCSVSDHVCRFSSSRCVPWRLPCHATASALCTLSFDIADRRYCPPLLQAEKQKEGQEIRIANWLQTLQWTEIIRNHSNGTTAPSRRYCPPSLVPFESVKAVCLVANVLRRATQQEQALQRAMWES